MKNKSWGLNTLKEKLHYYNSLLAKATDYEEKERLSDIIDSYKDFINCYITPNKTVSFQERFTQDQQYREKVKKIIDIILQANQVLNTDNLILPNKLLSIPTSKEQILKSTKTFYSCIGDIFYEIYEDYYNTNAMYIRFGNSYDDSQSGTFRPRGIQECFINIELFNSPYDIVTSVHEHSHAIAASINEDHLDNPLLREIDSIFFELLYTDSLSTKDYTPEQLKNLKSVIIGSRNASLTTVGIKEIIQTNNIRDVNTIKRIAQKKYSLDEYYEKDFFYSKLSDHVNYSLAYLIAIELFYIYKRYDFKALRILEEIIYIDDDEEFLVLGLLEELGITPGKNFQRFNKEFIKGTRR